VKRNVFHPWVNGGEKSNVTPAKTPPLAPGWLPSRKVHNPNKRKKGPQEDLHKGERGSKVREICRVEAETKKNVRTCSGKRRRLFAMEGGSDSATEKEPRTLGEKKKKKRRLRGYEHVFEIGPRGGLSSKKRKLLVKKGRRKKIATNGIADLETRP